MKEWCKAGCLPDDRDLAADLGAVDYGYDASDAILLERKDDMRKRGLASPDDGDALALTFAYPVARRDWAEERRVRGEDRRGSGDGWCDAPLCRLASAARRGLPRSRSLGKRLGSQVGGTSEGRRSCITPAHATCVALMMHEEHDARGA